MERYNCLDASTGAIQRKMKNLLRCRNPAAVYEQIYEKGLENEENINTNN